MLFWPQKVEGITIALVQGEPRGIIKMMVAHFKTMTHTLVRFATLLKVVVFLLCVGCRAKNEPFVSHLAVYEYNSWQNVRVVPTFRQSKYYENLNSYIESANMWAHKKLSDSGGSRAVEDMLIEGVRFRDYMIICIDDGDVLEVCYINMLKPGWERSHPIVDGGFPDVFRIAVNMRLNSVVREYTDYL